MCECLLQTFNGLLRNNKSVKEDNPNKRDKGLHINNCNLIVIISNELDQFEAAIF